MQLRALILSADLFEDSELLVPKDELEAAGVTVDVASVKTGTITGKHGHAVSATINIADVDPARYDLLVLPGGKAPRALREEPRVLDFTRRFLSTGKPVAAICHGPQVLSSAGVLRGRRLTGYPGIAEELRAAGAEFRDAEVVVDDNLISSRSPDDLPVFTKEILHALDREVKRTAVRR